MVTTAAATELTEAQRAGIGLVTRRPLVVSPLEAFFALHPGDRALVKVGEAVSRGQPILEHYADQKTIVFAGASSPDWHGAPGERWTQVSGGRERDGDALASGELLFRSGGSWRIAGGERPHPVEAPFDGVVEAVRPGTGVSLRTTSSGIVLEGV